MTTKRTLKLKLDMEVGEILPTVQKFTEAYNFVCQTAFEQKDWNSISIHHKVYKSLRKTLPAQLCIASRMKAMEAIKSMLALRKRQKKPATLPQSQQCSIRYDARSMSVFLERGEVSLLTIDGRKLAKFCLPEHFRQYLSWRKCSADLVIKKKQVFLHLVVENDFPEPERTGKVIGIDRGIRHIAVTSEGRFYSSKEIRMVRARSDTLRASLQSSGSRSAKRHLARVSGKDNRFCRDVNHCISKEIVESAGPGGILVLEDLTGVRERSNNYRKNERREGNRWSYFQLESFLDYKAARAGVAVERVNPAYTSQACSRCGKILKSNRKGQGFYSCSCGLRLNADLNAARNILAKLGTSIGQFQGLPPTSPTAQMKSEPVLAPLGA